MSSQDVVSPRRVGVRPLKLRRRFLLSKIMTTKLEKTLIFLIIFSFVPSRNTCGAQLRLDFWKDIRTYIWNATLDSVNQANQRLSWGFSSSINSKLTKEIGAKNRWLDDGRVHLNLDYPLTGRLKIGGLFSQKISSFEKRKTTNSEYGLTSELNMSGVRLFQMIGAKEIDRRFESGKGKDAGFNHQIQISHSPRILPDSKSHISVSQSNSRLTHIPILERDFSLMVLKNFSSEDSLKLSYQEGWSKKQFYGGSPSDYRINTQRRNERWINLQSSSELPLRIRTDLDFDFILNHYRYVYQLPGARDNLSVSQNFGLKMERGFFQRFTLASFYKFLRSQGDYLADEKDQKMDHGEWGGKMRFKISEADSLYLDASIGVASFYATPGSNLFSDWDLKTLFTWGKYKHVFNSFFSLRLEGGFKDFHQIYISDSLSANNNHDQTYVLSPTLIWRPHPEWEIMQNYNIQANYLFYDYETLKDSVFRQASLTTSLNCFLTHRVRLVLGYSYRYEDRGQLVWKDQWVRKPSWEQRIFTYNFSIQYQPKRDCLFSPEYTRQTRTSWSHFTDLIDFKNKRALRNKFYRDLIALSFKYMINHQNYINLSGVYRTQKSTGSARQMANYASVSVGRTF